jgi:serine/threonine-protein kinase
MDLVLTVEPKSPRKIEPEIPPELEKIILRCLEKDPKKRFGDASSLKAVILDAFPQFGKAG